MKTCCDANGNCQLSGNCRSTLGRRSGTACPLEELADDKRQNTLAALAAFWAILTFSLLAYGLLTMLTHHA